MKCKRCGSELEGNGLCPVCGAYGSGAADSGKIYDPAETISFDPVEQEDNLYLPDDNEPVRKKKKKQQANPLLIAIAVLSVVLVLIFGAIFVIKTDFTHLFSSDSAASAGRNQTAETACIGMSLSEKEMILMEGNSYSLVATVLPTGCTDKVFWFSADDSIVTVDENGTLTGVSGGVCNVMATCGSCSAVCRVTVSSKDPQPAAEEETEEPVQEPVQEETAAEPVDTGEMYLSATDITMSYPGEVASLTVKNAGDVTVEWTSDNPVIASVSSTGVVTALGTGTTYVRAKIGDQEFSCIVRLNLGGKEGEAVGAYLNTTDVTLTYAGETFKVKLTYDDDSYEHETPVWDSSDDGVCTVDSNGKVTAVGKGTAYVSTVVNGVTLKCIVRVSF